MTIGFNNVEVEGHLERADFDEYVDGKPNWMGHKGERKAEDSELWQFSYESWRKVRVTGERCGLEKYRMEEIVACLQVWMQYSVVKPYFTDYGAKTQKI